MQKVAMPMAEPTMGEMARYVKGMREARMAAEASDGTTGSGGEEADAA